MRRALQLLQLRVIALGCKVPKEPPGPPPLKRKTAEAKSENKDNVEKKPKVEETEAKLEKKTDVVEDKGEDAKKKKRKPKEPAAKKEEPEEDKPAVKAKPKANAGLTSGSLAVLRGTLATQLMLDADQSDDPAVNKELEKQKTELIQRAPRRSVAITEKNLHDQSFHDSRYYAEVASGKARDVAWKNEKGRRRAILERKSGVAERARERCHLHAECQSDTRSSTGSIQVPKGKM